MKKILSITLMLFVALSYSQRWSAYGIKVSPQNEEALVKVMNDYFSENPIEGVTVTLYSVMFTPADLNFTHEIIFNGEPEAMAKIYTPDFQNMAWQLFASKVNNYIDDTVFSGNGWRFLKFGPDNLPFQVVTIFDTDSWQENNKWLEMQNTMRTKYPRNDVSWMTGGITVGGPSSEGNTWTVQGYANYEDYITGWAKSRDFREANPKMVREREKMMEDIDPDFREVETKFMRLMVMQW